MRSEMRSKAIALFTLGVYLLTGSGHALADYACGQDLDGDGFADGQGETALCLGTGGGWFCPVGAVACSHTQSAPVCPPGGTFSPDLDVCLADATPSCPAGYTYQPLEDRCAADFSCPQGTTYDPEGDLCLGEETCPLGAQYPCVGAPGASRCSPNVCIDLSEPGNELMELPEEDAMYQNDGEFDEDGNCLGQLYIFSGKATRCRPPGVTVGYLNDCCDNDAQALSDPTTGSRVTTMVNAAKRSYEVAKVAYYSYQIASGAMTAVQGAGGAVAIVNTATGATVATFGSGSAIGAGVVAAEGAVAGGATASGAVSAGLQSYAGALINPGTIAVSVAVMVAMKVLFGGGCDQRDVETALLNDSDYCVYLGSVCEKRWAMVGCVQRSRRFCCFNSRMARIIHEQGRPQLKAFGPDGGWGDKKNPNCRGFTPEEFQQLDFAKIDLSEYFGDITRDMSQKIQGTQDRIQQGIQRHYEQVR
ncbi:MAG: conjugal transfer protein TraN [Desulfomicrobium apsheronum]|nr:conjugal transfer protein TraN [Desulfomicrobium apsheronum]